MISYFNPKYLEYILSKSPRLKTEYNLTQNSSMSDTLSALNDVTKKDFDAIKQHLEPEKNNYSQKNILNVGCGLATLEVYITNYYPIYKCFVQDKAEEIDIIKKDESHNEPILHRNNLDLICDFLALNGLSDFLVIDGDQIYNAPEKFDIIISLLTEEQYRPAIPYFDFIKEHLSEKGKLIIDITNNTDEDLLYKTFHSVNKITNKNDSVNNRYVCSKVI